MMRKKIKAIQALRLSVEGFSNLNSSYNIFMILEVFWWKEPKRLCFVTDESQREVLEVRCLGRGSRVQGPRFPYIVVYGNAV